MLGAARLFGRDMLVFWRYANGKGWIQYSAGSRGPAARSAFLFQIVHSEKAKMFHCEPLVEWSVER